MPFDIIVPDTKPATEWVRGRALRKVSPGKKHALLQAAMAERLRAWGRGMGCVGTEWDFRVTPPGERTRPLVPDVAYVSNVRLEETGNADADYPRMAPDVVVEIRSPQDAWDDLNDKIGTYLRSGSSLVIVVDPISRTVSSHDPLETAVYRAGDQFVHPAMPAFALDVSELFAELD